MRIGYLLAAVVASIGCTSEVLGAPGLPDLRLPGKNLVNNGGFERGTEGWRYFSGSYGGVVTDEKHQGSASFKAIGLSEDYRYFQQENVPLVPGKTYTLSAWMKCSGFKRAGDNTTFLNLVNWGWTKSAQIGPARADEGWTRHAVTFEAPSTKTIGERPVYNLVLFWPIKSEGTVWVDDIQIEEGKSATDFADQYLGWALEAYATVQVAHSLAQATRATIAAGFSELALGKSTDARATGLIGQCEALVGQVNDYAAQPLAVARSLPSQADKLRREAESLKYVYYLANPYLPLPEQPPPPTPPQALRVDWTCLAGEQRAVALNAVNFTGRASTARLEIRELFDLTRQRRCPGVPWVSAHSAPAIRGFLQPEKSFTDPLPRVDEAGCFPLGDGRVSQVVLVVDTAALPPGEYQGQVLLASLTEVTDKRPVDVHLTVLPVRLPPLSDVEVCDVGGVEDWAHESVGPLGLNTFFVQAQWVRPEYDPSGNMAMNVDFTRVTSDIRQRLALCPRARFVLGFGVGAEMTGMLQRYYGLEPKDPAFRTCAANWVREVLKQFDHLGVGPERVIFETVDEPGPGQLALAIQWSEIIRSVEPKARSMSYLTSLNTADSDLMRLYSALDIVAPIVGSLKPDAVAKLQQMGKTVWTYDCQNNGETFHPISYYRLLPWQGWRYGLKGWGHFEWLADDVGRRYRPWEGVAEEATVYPALGGGQVISRRWLALAAGVQDYRVLQALTQLSKTHAQSPAVARMHKLIAEAPAQALALLPASGDYFTGLAADADASLLDRFREDAAAAVRELVPARGEVADLRATLAAAPEKAALRLSLPTAGQVTARYLCDHRLPWRVAAADLPAGAQSLALPCDPGQAVTNCFVEFTGPDSLVSFASAKPLLTVTVDSSAEGYSPVPLNDGLATPGMKFERERGWISSGANTEHWVTAALQAPRPISEVRLWWMTFGGLPRAYKLQIWTERRWQDAPGFADWRAARSAVETLALPAIASDKVRVLQKAGGGGQGVPGMMGLSEIEVE